MNNKQDQVEQSLTNMYNIGIDAAIGLIKSEYLYSQGDSGLVKHPDPRLDRIIESLEQLKR